MKRWERRASFFILLVIIVMGMNPISPDNAPPICQPGQAPVSDEIGKWVCFTIERDVA